MKPPGNSRGLFHSYRGKEAGDARRTDVSSNNRKRRRSMNGFNGLILLFVYFAVMMAATLLFARKGNGADDFYVGNRKMGAVASAMSIAATWIWAPALFTSAEKAYINGVPGLFWFLVPNVLCLLFFIPFAERIRKRMPDGITLSGFMGHEYRSEGVRKVYGVQLAGLTILSTAVQLLAGGKILSVTTGLDFTLVTVLLAVIAYSYSQFSGIRASVMTDVVQMVLILAACAVFVPWALGNPHGIENMTRGFTGASGEYTSLFSGKGIEVLIGFGLPTAIGLVSGPFGDQCFWQRAFSIDEKKIGRAFALGAFLFGLVPLSMGILGFIAAGSGFTAQDTGTVNLELIQHLFPAWVVVPFIFMLMSGLLSTVDSNLCAAASLTTDWQVTGKLDDAGKMRFSKGVMVGLLVVGILIANIPGLTVTKMFLVYGTLRATTLLPTVMTLLGKKLRAGAVIAGVSVSLLTGLPVFAYATINNLSVLKSCAALYTVLISGIIAVVASKVRQEVSA